jgi:DNA polymerase-4
MEEIDATVVAIVDRLGRRLRKGRRACRTVILRLRFADFTRATRSLTVPQATTETRELLAVARGLLADATPLIRAQGLTLVGLSLTNLVDADRIQLALPLEPSLSPLDAAVDEVRERYGAEAITRGVLLGRDAGVVMPVLPD